MANSKFILHCKSCHAPLSKPVEVYEAGEDSAVVPDLPDEDHAIEKGFAFKSAEPYRQTCGTSKDALEFTPQFWKTIRDIPPSVKLTEDVRRLNGCCGLDGCEGPNRVCSCSAEIGTEMSDCWTSFLFIPEPQNTYWSRQDVD